MAYTMLRKIVVNVQLNNGTDSQGNVRTVGVSLGTLSTTGFDTNKIATIIRALAPCFSKSVYSIEKVEYSSIIG